MHPIRFKQQNVIYAEDQPQYLELPAFKSTDGLVCSCWKLSLKERIKLLLTGKLFLAMLTFNKPLQPVKLGVDFEEVN